MLAFNRIILDFFGTIRTFFHGTSSARCTRRLETYAAAYSSTISKMGTSINLTAIALKPLTMGPAWESGLNRLFFIFPTLDYTILISQLFPSPT
jgi:hypothetical protein